MITNDTKAQLRGMKTILTLKLIEDCFVQTALKKCYYEIGSFYKNRWWTENVVGFLRFRGNRFKG